MEEKPIGLAGIMGGENSMITDHVSTVLFEAANFNGVKYPSFQQKGRSPYRRFRKV